MAGMNIKTTMPSERIKSQMLYIKLNGLPYTAIYTKRPFILWTMFGLHWSEKSQVSRSSAAGSTQWVVRQGDECDCYRMDTGLFDNARKKF